MNMDQFDDSFVDQAIYIVANESPEKLPSQNEHLEEYGSPSQSEDEASNTEDDFCKNCGEFCEVILAHLAENENCLLWHKLQKSQKEARKEAIDEDNDSFHIRKTSHLDEETYKEFEQKLQELNKRLDNCEYLMKKPAELSDEDEIFWSEDHSGQQQVEFFDDDLMLQIKVKNIRPVTRKVCLRKSTEVPRKNYIKKDTCKHCNTSCKYILSHVTKSFRCQASYDMTKLREEALLNKKLRQRFYERNSNVGDSKVISVNNFREEETFNIRNRPFKNRRGAPSRDFKLLRQKYMTEYRERKKKRQLQLEFQQYHRELAESNDVNDLKSEEVIRMTQHILSTSLSNETLTGAPLKKILRSMKNDGKEHQITKFKDNNRLIKLTQSNQDTPFVDIELVEEMPSDDEVHTTLHIECKEEM